MTASEDQPAGRNFAQCSTCQGGPVCYCTDDGFPTTPQPTNSSRDTCPEWNCPDLSTEYRREGMTCPDHPCTCSADALPGGVS